MTFPNLLAQAQTIDIRDCPLDTVVFVDPWAGGSFQVKRVGTKYNWLCEEGFAPPDEIRRRVRSIIQAAGPRGFVFNLGHGIHLDTPIEGVGAAVEAVKSWSWT